jgi:hypothetical protein
MVHPSPGGAGTSVAPKRKRGRPPRPAARSFAVRAWFDYLSNRYRPARSAYELEKEFAAAVGQLTARWECSGRFRRYRAGSQGPKPEVIDTEECICHGSSAWINHSFWHLIETPNLPEEQLLEIIANLHPSVSCRVLLDRGHHGAAWPPIYTTEAEFQYLEQRADLDALTACLAITRLTWHAIRNERRHYRACVATYSILLGFFVQHPLSCVAEDLFPYVKHNFFDRSCQAIGATVRHEHFDVKAGIQRFHRLKRMAERFWPDLSLEQQRKCLYWLSHLRPVLLDDASRPGPRGELTRAEIWDSIHPRLDL